jgi:hypothetical protein
MKKVKIFLSGLIIGLSFIGAVGYASTIPVVPAGYTSSLAAQLGVSDTSMTLARGTDISGATLSGYICFTVDEGTPSVEYVCGTTAGTAVTSLLRGIDPITGVTTITAMKKSHRLGASVKVTDYPVLGILARLLNGNDTLLNAIKYYAEPTWVYGTHQLVTWDKAKDYTDSVALAGAPNADTATKGIVQLATSLQAASSTATGSTGAALVLPASMATDTPNTSTRAGKVIMSDLTGYIKQGWLNLSQAFTWAGLHIFNGGLTSNATTTIAASNVSSNALVLNALNYAFPSNRGASSTVFMEDGNGNLTMQSVLMSMGTTTGTSTSVAAASGNYNSDVIITTGFRPRYIRLTYYIQSWTTSGTYVGHKGIAWYSGTTLVSIIPLWGSADGTSKVQDTGGSAYPGAFGTTPLIYKDVENDVGVTSLIAGNRSGSDDNQVSATINSINSTGFVLRTNVQTGLNSIGKSFIFKATWEAYP